MRAIVVGAGFAGLGAALALARDGHRVALLERDSEATPGSVEDAFVAWRRPGVPQFRHSHAFLARLRNLIRKRAPDLYDALLQAGAEELPLRRLFPGASENDAAAAGDDDLVMLACRRSTFEYVLRRAVLARRGVELVPGAHVVGLDASDRADHDVPRIAGVVVDGPGIRREHLEADFVVDASGRGSHARDWLIQIGARPPDKRRTPCGIFYASRFYRERRERSLPANLGELTADLGYLKYGVFPGDRGTFSLSIAVSSDDRSLRPVAGAAGFDRAAQSLPIPRGWLERAEPLGKVRAMTGLDNVHCPLVQAGRPVALGFFAIGDAAIHTNPIYGRGCTLAFVHAYLLADVLRRHGPDMRACALALHEATAREIEPWYDDAVSHDVDWMDVSQVLRRCQDPYDPIYYGGLVDLRVHVRSFLRDGLLPALRRDLSVFRAFMRSMNLVAPPESVLQDPAVAARVLGVYLTRYWRLEPVFGPPRAQMCDLIAGAA